LVPLFPSYLEREGNSVADSLAELGSSQDNSWHGLLLITAHLAQGFILMWMLLELSSKN